MAKKSKPKKLTDPEQVAVHMEALKHPLKAEVLKARISGFPNG